VPRSGAGVALMGWLSAARAIYPQDKLHRLEGAVLAVDIIPAATPV